MKKVLWGVCALAFALAMAGCATTKSGSVASLEGRVQTLENKVDTIEANLQSGAPSASSAGLEVIGGAVPASAGVTIEGMTKNQIQEALKNAGYYDGEIDGKIGPKTRAAIMDFQKDMSLKVDGVAGRKTKEKLLKYLP